MARIIIAPNRYVQGPGVLADIADYAVKYGKKPFILISEGGKKRFGEGIEKSFEGTGIELTFEVFRGECSKNEINRLNELVKEGGCDLVIGVGGGKIFDTAKAVAYYCATPVIVVPTIAATDAPCSALSVVYTDDGVFEEYLWLPANPNLVLVDSQVVANAPARLLVSGMGDALATYFEAKACQVSNATSCAGGTITTAAITLAKVCYDTLIAEGVKAKLAVENNAVTEAVEKIIEANTLLSGMGFESGGLAGAHAIHNGLTAIKECHHLYHGEKVAFGTLTQLVLENADEDLLDEVVGFCMDVGLPTTFADLGIENVDKDALMEAAELAAAPTDTCGNEPVEITPQKVYDAMIAADAIGRYYKGE